MAGLKYWLWLSTMRHVGIRNLLALLDHFGTPEKIFFASDNELEIVLGADVRLFHERDLGRAEEILSRCRELGISILTIGDAAYPSRLRNIFDPPIVLYIKGSLPDIDEEAAVAMVGTRRCTPYGIVTAEKLAYEVTRLGGLIVTGLARGVDSAAARGALRAGGRVVGVMGCGLDVVYPRSNRALLEDVAVVGALVSEYPPGTQPEARNFPVRNRILSGLSLGVTLVEAPERSGALITASLALDQGRDVFVVPGNIDASSCAGSNALLKEGAVPVMNGHDILESYYPLFPSKLKFSDEARLNKLEPDAAERLVDTELAAAAQTREKMTSKQSLTPAKTTKKVIDNNSSPDYIDLLVDAEELSENELRVLRALTKTMHIDELILSTGLSAGEVSSALTMLEISGAVTQEPGKYFSPHFRFK